MDSLNGSLNGWTGFIVYTIDGIPKGLISILLISFFVTLLQLLAYKKFSNQQRIKEIKERQKIIQKELRNIKDEKTIKKLNDELIKSSGELLKISTKPMLITLLPLLFLLWFLRKSYTAAGIGNIITWPWNLPIIGNGAGWLLCFIIFSIIFNLILRKLLKVY